MRPDYNASLTDPNSFLRQGDIVEHWDNLQVAWDTAMDVLHGKDTLKHTMGGAPFAKSQTGSSSEGKCVHPILAITPGMTQLDGYGSSYCASVKRQQYIQYTELLLEELDASSLFLAPAPMLAAFSMGRQTALVVDIGAGGTRISPVVDGLLLEQAQRRSGRGGGLDGARDMASLVARENSTQTQIVTKGAYFDSAIQIIAFPYLGRTRPNVRVANRILYPVGGHAVHPSSDTVHQSHLQHEQR